MPPTHAPGNRRGAASSGRRHAIDDGYWHRSKQPLPILIFLLPLIIAYEISLVAVLTDAHGGVRTIAAHKSLLTFFDMFGVPARGGLILGGVLIVVVLLVWQVLSRDPWRLHTKTVLGMAAESALLAAPLLVIGQVIARTLPAAGPLVLAGGQELVDLPISARLAISIGAGLYEELLFRLLLIAAVHLLLVDVGGLKSRTGTIIAVAVSAFAFMLYHELRPDGVLSLQRLAFFMVAGLYFSAVFVVRGFGIVVAVHAIYDIVTALFLVPPHAG